MILFCRNSTDMNSDLVSSAKAGDLESMKHILATESSHPYVDMALYAASEARVHIDVFRELLAHEADATLSDNFPILEAARSNRGDLVRLLVEFGADPCVQGRNIPLRYACMFGNTELVRFLLQKGAKPDVNRGFSLIVATKKNFVEICKLLLENEADPNVRDGAPIFHAAELGREEICRLLLRYGAWADDSFALLAAIDNGHRGICELLLRAGADPNGGDCFMLPTAIERGDVDMVRLLIQYGVWVNNGMALYVAVKHRHQEILRLLIDNGADPSRNNNLLLLHAIMHNNLEAVVYLIEEVGVEPVLPASDCEKISRCDSRILSYFVRRGIYLGQTISREAAISRCIARRRYRNSNKWASLVLNIVQKNRIRRSLQVLKQHTMGADNCSICLVPILARGQHISDLKCGHMFHSRCREQWKRRSSTCPVCRSIQ